MSDSMIERISQVMFEAFFTGDNWRIAWDNYTEAEKRGFHAAALAAIKQTSDVLQERYDKFDHNEAIEDFTLGYLAAINDLIAELP